MNNKNFKVGSHILVQGNMGIVEEITNCVEYKVSYGYEDCGERILTEEQTQDMLERGYKLTATGRTATYFKVNFENEFLQERVKELLRY